jgi:soluble lytic murein transglycosylase-like protein
MHLRHQKLSSGNAIRRGLVLAPVAVLLTCSPAIGFAAADGGTEYRLQSSTAEIARPATEPYQSQFAAYRLVSKEEVVASGTTPPALPAAFTLEKPFAKEVSQAAEAAGVEPGLVHALIEVESAYRPNAISPKGAVGLMQLLPETAQRYGVSNLTSVPDNLKAGTRHLRSLLDVFGERLDLVLAAYNAGEGAVRKYNNAVPPYRETRDYVPAVLKRYRKAENPAPVPKTPAIREYMPGTRLDPNALKQLP